MTAVILGIAVFWLLVSAVTVICQLVHAVHIRRLYAGDLVMRDLK